MFRDCMLRFQAYLTHKIRVTAADLGYNQDGPDLQVSSVLSKA